jgi:hypothetical protein
MEGHVSHKAKMRDAHKGLARKDWGGGEQNLEHIGIIVKHVMSICGPFTGNIKLSNLFLANHYTTVFNNWSCNRNAHLTTN